MSHSSEESDAGEWSPIDDLQRIEEQLDKKEVQAGEIGHVPRVTVILQRFLEPHERAVKVADAESAADRKEVPPLPPGITASQIAPPTKRPRKEVGGRQLLVADMDFDTASVFRGYTDEEIFGGRVHPDDFCGTLLIQLKASGYGHGQIADRIKELYTVLGDRSSRQTITANAITKRWTNAFHALERNDPELASDLLRSAGSSKSLRKLSHRAKRVVKST